MARSLNAQPILTLDRYRQLLNIPLCLFNGVEKSGESTNGCDHCWTQWERDQLAQALYDAEDTLAGELKFYLGKHYLSDNDLHWANPMQLKWGHIVGGGVRGRVAVVPTASDFTTDPATITVTAASFPGGTSEIKVIETSTGLEIVPDSIAISGLNYIISINQCKLIEWDDLQNQVMCITYNATFPATTWLKLADLTVYREYLDTSDQATITFAPDCDCWTTCAACAGDEFTGCVFVLDEEISKVRISMADYTAGVYPAAGSWTCAYPDVCCCAHGSKVSVNYQAGTTDVPGYEQAIYRLAHTFMVLEPCGCATYDATWQRDVRIPSTLTAERINCPFGEMDGAWYAWRWANRNKHGTGIMLGKVAGYLRRDRGF